MILALALFAASSPHIAPQAMAGTVEPTKRADDQGTGQPITGITFIGSEAPAVVADAARPFIGRPNTRRTLAELVAALTRAYEHSPVALYTVAIPGQDFADGIVKVSLTESRGRAGRGAERRPFSPNESDRSAAGRRAPAQPSDL